MEREDIGKYAEECAEANMITPIDCPFYDEDYNEYKEAYIKTFNQGVEYADSHPKSPWISSKEDLPCNHEELISTQDKATKKVIVMEKYDGVMVDFMKKAKSGVWYWSRSIKVLYWMPIPELPKE